jgi:hypothetical protein
MGSQNDLSFSNFLSREITKMSINSHMASTNSVQELLSWRRDFFFGQPSIELFPLLDFLVEEWWNSFTIAENFLKGIAEIEYPFFAIETAISFCEDPSQSLTPTEVERLKQTKNWLEKLRKDKKDILPYRIILELMVYGPKQSNSSINQLLWLFHNYSIFMEDHTRYSPPGSFCYNFGKCADGIEQAKRVSSETLLKELRLKLQPPKFETLLSANYNSMGLPLSSAEYIGKNNMREVFDRRMKYKKQRDGNKGEK